MNSFLEDGPFFKRFTWFRVSLFILEILGSRLDIENSFQEILFFFFFYSFSKLLGTKTKWKPVPLSFSLSYHCSITSTNQTMKNDLFQYLDLI